MIVLGIESTAHTFSASVMDGKKVLSLESKTLTTESGGLIPREIIEHHLLNGPKIINKGPKDHINKNQKSFFPSVLPGKKQEWCAPHPPSKVFANVGRMTYEAIWALVDNSSINQITRFKAQCNRCPSINY